MVELAIPEDPAEFDRVLEALPNRPAVFLLWPRAGKPYLARTNVLRKRLKRLLGESRRRRSNVSSISSRGSRLEAQFLVLELARKHLGASVIATRFACGMPPYVKLILSNQFPRTQVSRRISAGRRRFTSVRSATGRRRRSSNRSFSICFSCGGARKIWSLARTHPGCIYGEMGRCLRPCQQAVGVEEYRRRGRARRGVSANQRASRCSALAESARERLSAEMDFEGAALMHQRCQRIERCLGCVTKWRAS